MLTPESPFDLDPDTTLVWLKMDIVQIKENTKVMTKLARFPEVDILILLFNHQFSILA